MVLKETIMASIKYNPHGQKGKVTYNSDIVNGIAALSLRETEGIELVSSKGQGIKTCFEKEGVFVDISVIAHYGYKVPELAFRIQQNVKQMVESMTKFKIAKVDVHITSVIFPDAKAPTPAENETPAEQTANV